MGTRGERFFHGGKPGLRPGDLLAPQPADEPGWRRQHCEMCASGIDNSHHPDSIYVTNSRDYARYYASRYGKGDLYTVEPLGELITSDEDPIPTWRCSAARVLTVYDRNVTLTRAQRRHVFKMFPPDPRVPWYTFEQMERDARRLALATKEKEAYMKTLFHDDPPTATS